MTIKLFKSIILHTKIIMDQISGKTRFEYNGTYDIDENGHFKVVFGYIPSSENHESFVVLNTLSISPDEWSRDVLSEMDNVKRIYSFLLENGYKPLTIEVCYEDIHSVSPHLIDTVENKKIQSFTIDCTRRKLHCNPVWNDNEPVVLYQM